MELIIGRNPEKEILQRTWESVESELVAVVGRRRIGKTFLINSFFREKIIFAFSGSHSGVQKQQLTNFSIALNEFSKSSVNRTIPKNWTIAFEQLKTFIARKKGKQKKVIFFDEFPWIHTKKSNFLATFEHFWNTWASKRTDLIVVICGSSASWMVQKVINNKGGLHNRITRKIRLLPFTLHETELYLQSRQIKLDRYQLVQLYMAFGGIPHYLKAIEKGESAAQNIDRMCFTKDGLLAEEFSNLYPSLFEKSSNHLEVARVLSKKAMGLTRNELVNSIRLVSGGGLTKVLTELVESGFITTYIPFNKRSNARVFKLTDEFSLFYMKFMEHSSFSGTDVWLRISSGNLWKTWSGFAFERICLKHIGSIKKTLGISGVYTNVSIWRTKGDANESGAQIDLIIDRDDHCINIFEMKYYNARFSMTKKYASEWREKLEVFRENTKTRKTLFLTFLSTFGLNENQHSIGLVRQSLSIDALFAE